MINVRDYDQICAARPFLVAHRGGVITPESPENTLRAIELAAEQGYTMAELDVMEAADREPVLIHDGLFINCGVRKPVCALTSEEITAIRYRASDKPVATLAQAIALCAKLGLGVMLDKLARDDRDNPAMSAACLERVSSLIKGAGLASSTVAIVDTPALRDALGDVALFPMTRGGVPEDLSPAATEGRFWFGWGAEIDAGGIARLHDAGVLAIVSINTFHYPHHMPYALAQQDIERLVADGMDGFQIDSVYRDCFTGIPREKITR